MTESNKSQQLLGSLQPRNQLFIVDTCWQREDPVRQGNIFHEPAFMELLLLLPLVPEEIPGFHELCKDPAAARAGQGLPGQCWELEEPGSCSVLPRGAGSAWPCCCAGTGWGSAGGSIHHRGSSGCKYSLGQCEIVMAIRSCHSSQDTRKALCSSLGMLGSLAHGGGLCQNCSSVEQVLSHSKSVFLEIAAAADLTLFTTRMGKQRGTVMRD